MDDNYALYMRDMKLMAGDPRDCLPEPDGIIGCCALCGGDIYDGEDYWVGADLFCEECYGREPDE